SVIRIGHSPHGGELSGELMLDPNPRLPPLVEFGQNLANHDELRGISIFLDQRSGNSYSHQELLQRALVPEDSAAGLHDRFLERVRDLNSHPCLTCRSDTPIGGWPPAAIRSGSRPPSLRMRASLVPRRRSRPSSSSFS